MNFFERMEREINFNREYQKIEDIILNERDICFQTINEEIEANFRKWKDRGNFTSFGELREYLGFEYQNRLKKYVPVRTEINLNDFLIYCEMLLNMFYNVVFISRDSCNKQKIQDVINTIKYDLNLINYELVRQDNKQIIAVQKDAMVSSAVDLVEPKLADLIVKYNHHTLRGDLDAKRDILGDIAHALEPRREELRKENKTIEGDFFYLVNNMNIRHNNCNKTDDSKYFPVFDNLSANEKENWYDLIYQEGLMAFLIMEQVKRNEKINEFKQQASTTDK